MEEGKCSGRNGAPNTTELHYNRSTDLKPQATYIDNDDDDLFEGNAGSVVCQRRKDTQAFPCNL